MGAAQYEINAPAPETWEAAHQGQQIEALISMAANDQACLLRQERRLIDAAQTVGIVLTVERGLVMRNNRAESIEHFGYVDGQATLSYFRQKMWANLPDLVSKNTGIDSEAGQHRGHPRSIEQRWPLKWGKLEMTPFDVRGFVTMEGGELLFAPSFQFLKSL
jgi:hypothetical protein